MHARAGGYRWCLDSGLQVVQLFLAEVERRESPTLESIFAELVTAVLPEIVKIHVVVLGLLNLGRHVLVALHLVKVLLELSPHRNLAVAFARAEHPEDRLDVVLVGIRVVQQRYSGGKTLETNLWLSRDHRQCVL